MNFGSLFSGIGGFDLGFEQAGLECSFQCEIDDNAVSVLDKHYPEIKKFRDVTKMARRLYDCEQIDEDEFLCPRCEMEFGDCECSGADEMLDEYPIDILVGGFPCQDISAGRDRWGAKGINGERSGLWFEYKRIIDELQPKWAIVENTGRLRNGRNGDDFRAIVEGFTELNYVGIGFVIDAAAFNLPARRPRVIIMARRIEQGFSSISDWKRLANCFLRNDPGFVILERGGQSLTTDNGFKRPRPESYRKLTPLECERALGFPDNWTAGQSNTTRYKQIGNAVAVPVAKFIGKVIMEFEKEQENDI